MISSAIFPGFVRHGSALPESPVVISVPHAGRDYDAGLIADAAVGIDRLRLLEDRHAERLVEKAMVTGATIFTATRPRAWLDLNRDPREIDMGMVTGTLPGARPSARTRAGLGLVPRRLGNGPELWRRKLDATEIEARISDHHRPWHAALDAALDAALALHGSAILLDCHSMPPLRPDAGGMRADLVIGDRHGRSASEGLVARIEMVARAAGLRVARNSPYAGGHALDRHGRPEAGVHAIQIEICRSLYLDAALDHLGPGLGAMQELIAEIHAALADAISPTRLAAE